MGETTAFITVATIEILPNPSASTHLEGVELTLSNRTAVFTIEEDINLNGATSVTAQLTADGTTLLGNTCAESVATFYIDVVGYDDRECPPFNQTGNSL